MIDVDHFKRINDTFGHASGDKTLVTVVDRLTSSLRQGDLLGRWGGEEFLVVLPRTDLFAARLVADRLREAVGAAPVPVGNGGDEISVTVSIGVAASLERSPEALLLTADRALYTAKAAGRDRVMS
jgi:diguanylate cyclase (GGDEF)-like protein